VEGRYEPIEIQELPGGVLQGYIRALRLYLLWEEGRLAWHDPAIGQLIAAREDERQCAPTRSGRTLAGRG